ncbi:MAG TPA: LptF/LptG family permease [Fimbriimonadaceae bacterium]|nr:LptF/LptG family permease [Fimbriimonadaceae bacterium]
MKRLDRYVIRELLVPFLIGTLAVVLMFDINMVMAYTKQFDISNIPKLALFQMILYKTPYWMNMTLPVGMSLGASLAMSRLARESELTAMRTAGARVLRVIAPIAAFGVLVAIGDYLMVEKVMPGAERKFTSLEQKFGLLVVMPNLSENTIVRLPNMQVSIGHAQRTGEGSMDLRDIVVFDRTSNQGVQIIRSDHGSYNQGEWVLQGADIWWLAPGEATAMYTMETARLHYKVSIADLLMPPGPEQQTAAQIRESIANAQRMHLASRELEIQYQIRFSVPASCILFALVAPALAIMFARSGFAGVLLSIFLVFLYYNVFVFTTEILGKNSHISPVLAAWSPNLLFAILGLFAIRRLE